MMVKSYFFNSQICKTVLFGLLHEVDVHKLLREAPGQLTYQFLCNISSSDPSITRIIEGCSTLNTIVKSELGYLRVLKLELYTGTLKSKVSQGGVRQNSPPII